MATLLAKIKKIEGWLRDDEAKLLFNLAKNTSGNEVIVEIGSWKGKSTTCLGLGSKEGSGSPVYAIDPHTGSPEHHRNGKVDTFAEFKQNVHRAGIENLVKPIRQTSHQASKKFKEPIKLLFIDGDHSYRSVKQDFLDWSRKLIDGGTIAFHDTISWPGPRRLVLEKIYHGHNFKKIKLVGSITYAEKTIKLTLIDKSGNLYALAIRQLRNIFAALPLPPTVHSIFKSLLQKIQ